MKPYEMTYIVRPDLDEEQTRATVEQVSGRITGAGGELIAALPWNPPRRRMAYTINDFGDGFYVTTVFRIDPPALRAIETALKLNDRILRFLLVQATDLNIKQAQQRLQQQAAAAAAPRPQPMPVPQPGAEQPAPSAAVAAPEAAAPATTTADAAPSEGAAAPVESTPPPAAPPVADTPATVPTEVETVPAAAPQEIQPVSEAQPVAAGTDAPATAPEE